MPAQTARHARHNAETAAPPMPGCQPDAGTPRVSRFVQTLVIQSPVGLHLRPAALVAKTASAFTCDITLVCEGREANARSLLSIVMLQAGNGARVEVATEGHDAEAAMCALVQLFETGLGE